MVQQEPHLLSNGITPMTCPGMLLDIHSINRPVFDPLSAQSQFYLGQSQHVGWNSKGCVIYGPGERKLAGGNHYIGEGSAKRPGFCFSMVPTL
jgi:hypothetical protein